MSIDDSTILITKEEDGVTKAFVDDDCFIAATTTTTNAAVVLGSVEEMLINEEKEEEKERQSNKKNINNNNNNKFVKSIVDLLKRAETTEPYLNLTEWRREPYEPIPYKALKQYEAAADMPSIDSEYIQDKLKTSLPNGWTDIPPISKEFQTVIDKHKNSNDNSNNNNNSATNKNKHQKQQQIGSELTFEDLPAWAKWAKPDVSNHIPLQLDVDVEIRHLWGMDCYTRAAVMAAISQAEGFNGQENLKKREDFLTKKLMRTVHILGEDGWDMEKAAQIISEDAEKQNDFETKKAAECLIRAIKEIDEAKVSTNTQRIRSKNNTEHKQKTVAAAATTINNNSTRSTRATNNNSNDNNNIEVEEVGNDDGGHNITAATAATTTIIDDAEIKKEEEEEVDPRTTRRHYRLHPKGVGVVCIRKEGLEPGTFVNHYLGEMYSPWRWYERCDSIKKRNPSQDLPSFFNITLERPKEDSRGKDTIFVEAMHECEFASRMSHSCAGNCQTTVISHEGKLSIGVYTHAKIECGEELCWDYSCVTESEKEFRAAICLCSSPNCRGSFLSYAGSSTFTAVMNEKHNFLHRNAILCRACVEPLAEEDLALLSEFGIRDSALNTVSGERAPDWLVKWASLILRYVRLEEKMLPEALCKLPMQNGIKYNMEGAKAEMYGIVATRLQNIVVTLDKIKYFLRQPKQCERPYMREASEEEIIRHLWTGNESIVKRALSAVSRACGILKNVSSHGKQGVEGQKSIIKEVEEEEEEKKEEDAKIEQNGEEKEKEEGEQNGAPVMVDSTADDHAIALALSEGYDVLLPSKTKTTSATHAATTTTTTTTTATATATIATTNKMKKTVKFTGNPNQVIDQLVERSKSKPSSASEAKDWLREVSNSIRSLGMGHSACADALLMYARTERWFTPEKFVGFSSPPVQLREHDPGSELSAVKVSTHVKNTLIKKYLPNYPWGQLVAWFKQTVYDPTASLSAERRGTISLPDIDSAYSGDQGVYAKTERKQLVRILRENASRIWPTTMQWSFKNYAKMYGSPWFDDALMETEEDFANLEAGRRGTVAESTTTTYQHKKQTLLLLRELDEAMSTGMATGAHGVVKKTSMLGIDKKRKNVNSSKSTSNSAKAEVKRAKRRNFTHIYAKGADGKPYKCGNCRTCLNPLMKKRCVNTPILNNNNNNDDVAMITGAVMYGTTIDSLMTMKCVECQGEENEDKMLICDACDLSSHTYCCGLDAVPDVEYWFCAKCAGSEKEEEFNQKHGITNPQQQQQQDLE